MSIVQVILIVFIIFAVSRAILRLRQGNLTALGFAFWMSIWILALIGVVFPEISTDIAKFLGIGRGVDVIIYLSIMVLYYLVFRIYIIIEDLRQEITKLVSSLSIENERLINLIRNSRKSKSSRPSKASNKK